MYNNANEALQFIIHIYLIALLGGPEIISIS